MIFVFMLFVWFGLVWFVRSSAFGAAICQGFGIYGAVICASIEEDTHASVRVSGSMM